MMLQGTLGAQVRRTATMDIVGCGAVTRRFHLPALAWLERQGLLRVRYCLDPDAKAAAFLASQFRGARPFCVSAPTAFDGTGAAVVLVATPPEHHSAWAQHYLEAGSHVLVEKPAVVSTEQYSLLQQVTRETRRCVLVGHVRRLFPSVVAARALVTDGRIGTIRRIEAYEGLRWSWSTRSDFPVSSRAGGVLYDLGSHVLDMALFICGLDDLAPGTVATEVLRLERWPSQEPSHEFDADLALGMPSGEIPLAIRLSRREPLANVVRVRGDQGELLVSAWHSRTVLLRANGGSQRQAGDLRSVHAATSQGCFVEEHLEAWRTWALGQQDSPLHLRHFGFLTWLVQTLAAEA
ncbi:MAG: Gfo/Idh/MocA family oxidoreductase [Armatimonadota bacterium]|nr:Gfo/Idh/MocA family oxidoreductase [Armatimonadota bacterium]MDR7540374.1 Gfo/Idh/MocA family oxidoreductase [Armatimonadota bacterium]